MQQILSNHRVANTNPMISITLAWGFTLRKHFRVQPLAILALKGLGLQASGHPVSVIGSNLLRPFLAGYGDVAALC